MTLDKIEKKLFARFDELERKLGLSEGDYDEYGANLRNSFNRRHDDKPELWEEFHTLEAILKFMTDYDNQRRKEIAA